MPVSVRSFDHRGDVLPTPGGGRGVDPSPLGSATKHPLTFSQSLEEVFKLWEILSRSGRGQRERAADLTDVLQGARCLTMCALWAYDNLLYLDATDTVDFCAERATRGFSRAWSVGSALLIWLSLMELQKVWRW